MEQAYTLDAKIGNTLWADALSKKMENVRLAFEVIPDGKPVPTGHQFVQCYVVFDIKMEDFRQKARLVAGGMTEAPATIMYASIVLRETVRIPFMIATLNDLEVQLGNILNAYIQAPVTEKVWATLSPEFSKDSGKTEVIVGASYGRKSAGAAFRSHLAKCMESLGYKSCKADPVLQLKPAEDKVKYYSYLLCNIDDILCIHYNADVMLEWLHKSFQLKPGVGKPDMYLGAKLCKTRLHNGVWACALSPIKYV